MQPELRRGRLIDLPGRAGELQRGDSDAALLQELGDHYAKYHEFLRRALEDAGGDPDPADFRGESSGFADDADGYARQAETFQRIFASEILLRQARVHRKDGRDADDPLLDHPPVLDSDGSLVDAEHPERARFDRTPAFRRLDSKPKISR